MKAVVYTQYGSPEVLQLKEVDKPVPKDNEVLVRNKLTTVTAADYRLRSFKMPLGFWALGRLAMGITGPRKRILGTEFAGVIVAVGKDVTSFKVGDAVFGLTGIKMGGYAEYLCMPEQGAIVTKPEGINFEEVVGIPFGASTALYYLRDLGKIQRGQKVLIYGASGGVGTAAVQIAKYYGAEVTGVCSTANLEMVKSLGADKVIDYTQVDFTKNGETYDLVLETVGKISFSQCKQSLKENGLCLLVVASIPQFLQVLWTSIIGGKKVLAGMAPGNKQDLLFLNKLLEAGKVKVVIDRRYALAEIAEAHRYADTGRKKGNIIITVEK